MKLKEIELRIQILKDYLSKMEQRLMDDRNVNLHEYREALKELYWLRILKDTENYEEDKNVNLHDYRESLKELYWLRILKDTENYEEDEEI